MKPVLTKRFIDSLILTTALCLHVFCISNATAEIRTITATGEYRMGDNDTRTDAKRLALLDAKRLSLEQAGVYIESITEVNNLDLTKEEIRAYTAGIVEVIEQKTRTAMEGDGTVVRVDVTAKIDTDVVTQQIEALRQNYDVKSKLLEAEFRAYKLQKELEAKTQELTSAKSRAMVDALNRQRQQLMTHADVENLVTRARVVLAGQKGYTLMVGNSTPESRKYARGLIQQALSYEPQNTEALGLLGFVQFEEGQREEAISTFRNIAKMEPLSAYAHMNLGKVLQATGDWLGAAKEYETARKLEPDNAEAHASLGQVLPIAGVLLEQKENATSEERDRLGNVRQQLMERAVEALREATRLSPRNAKYHRELGSALYSLAASRNFIRLDIKKDEVERILAAARRDRDEGLGELRQAVALDPSNAEFHKALGNRLDEEEAITEYRTVVQLNPRDVSTRIDLGTMLLNKKDLNGAREQFQAAVRVDQKNTTAHVRLGETFEKMDQLDRAIEEYQRAVTVGPVPLGTGYRLSHRVDILADALARAGKRKEAGQLIRDYLKSNADIEPLYGPTLREKLQEFDRE